VDYALFFRWFTGSRKKNEVRCKKGRGNTFEIAGEGHYQANLIALAGGEKTEDGVKLDVEAVLEPEPNNPHDSKAVAVLIKKKKIGYLRRDDAPKFVSFLNEIGAERALCSGRIVGGWDRGSGDEGHFGVKLSLSWPPKLEK